ncbi:MAG: carbohydrate-binding family 9-like protein, partial [Opitutales bacterium]
MRKTSLPLLLSFLFGFLAEAAETTLCRWAHVPPVIDGKDEDSAWKTIENVGPFQRAWEKNPEKRKPLTETKAKVCWDRDNFYFFARMVDGDLFAKETEQDGNLWEGDVFEIFFKPSEDFSGYYEFEFNPNNAQLDLYMPQRRAGGFPRFKQDFPFTMETAVQLDGSLNKWTDRDKGWSVEGKIRWRDFVRAGGRPRAGDTWKFALSRYDFSVDFDGPYLSSIAPLKQADFHRYEDYLPLRFEGPEGDHPTKPYGISELPPLPDLKLKGRPGKPPPYQVKRAYPNLKLPFPITMAVVPGTNVMLAVIQDWSYAPSRIIRFEDKPDVDSFETMHKYDGVVYDFAFHPKFAENGFFYVGW